MSKTVQKNNTQSSNRLQSEFQRASMDFYNTKYYVKYLDTRVVIIVAYTCVVYYKNHINMLYFISINEVLSKTSVDCGDTYSK